MYTIFYGIHITSEQIHVFLIQYSRIWGLSKLNFFTQLNFGNLSVIINKFTKFNMLKILNIFTDVFCKHYVSVLSYYYLINISKSESSKLRQNACIYLQFNIFLWNKKIEFSLTAQRNPSNVLCYLFLRFYQSCLFPLYYPLSLITRNNIICSANFK
jgi:hypothetical protein